MVDFDVFIQDNKVKEVTVHLENDVYEFTTLYYYKKYLKVFNIFATLSNNFFRLNLVHIEVNRSK